MLLSFLERRFGKMLCPSAAYSILILAAVHAAKPAVTGTRVRSQPDRFAARAG